MIGSSWYTIASLQAYYWAVKNKKEVILGPIEFNFDMFQHLKIIKNYFVYKILYRKVTKLLANSFIHYDYLTLVLKLRRVTLFMNYDNYIPYLKHPTRTKSDCVTFMYGGAIDRRMRVPEVLNVFKKIARNFSNVKFIIAGYGPEKQKCKTMTKASKVLKNIVNFHDVESWNQIPDVYKKSDVLINYASYSPGSGVILSAIASGMGVISNIAIQSTRHFLIDNYNGFIVDDEKSLYKAMENYILNKNLIEEHSKRSKSIGLNTLTYSQHLEDFKKITEKKTN